MRRRNRDTVVIAVPKGRILEQLSERLERASIPTEALTANSRKLVREDQKSGLRYLLLKPDDVPTYVEYGAADLGIVGRDVLMERNYDVLAPVDLDIGKCRMMVCGLPEANLTGERERPLRVATKFPHIAERHFRSKGTPVELIFCQGSVELAPLTGLADVIVDLVETGETLRQNGLVTLEKIADISSVLIANRAGLKLRRSTIQPILDALRG
ncbi:MAG TPA: ATP phosphoribosyltransferase [Polyangiales bacterium]|jgi:ATP phosphoribosyltransferase|nr:ATP phosphoribosyltransferase [Polyangiales bacterium]